MYFKEHLMGSFMGNLKDDDRGHFRVSYLISHMAVDAYATPYGGRAGSTHNRVSVVISCSWLHMITNEKYLQTATIQTTITMKHLLGVRFKTAHRLCRAHTYQPNTTIIETRPP